MPTNAQRRNAISAKGASNAAARKRAATNKKKIAALKKKLKVGQIRTPAPHPNISSATRGRIKRAYDIESGGSRMTLFEDDDGIKIVVRKVEAGKEGEVGLMMNAMLERLSRNASGEPQITSVISAMDDLSNLNAVNNALVRLRETVSVQQKVKIDREQELKHFRARAGIAEPDPASQDSYIEGLKAYLEKASGNRSSKAYKEILSLLDQAITEEKSIKSNPRRVQSDIAKLFDLSNQIARLMAEAESTNGSAQKAEQRNTALKNLKVLLDDHMMSQTWATGVMTINDQKMIASGADMLAIKNKIETMKAKGIELTPNQAWAVVAAQKKAAAEADMFKQATAERLVKLNQDWGTNYSMADIETLKNYLPKLKVATNYYLDRTPGDNIGSLVNQDKTLGDQLLESDTFKNVWETGASQAAVSPDQRGAIEESMGYAQALNRQAGEFQMRTDTTSSFEVRDQTELPKYAALVSQHQKNGVDPRYGQSVITWKNDSVQERMTHTPGDSWNMDDKGVRNYTHLDQPYAITANSEPVLLRFLLAEATGKDGQWFEKAKQEGAPFRGYIETQIHGKLDWSDAERIVVGFDPDNGKDEQWARNYAQKLDNLKKEKGYTFEIALRDKEGNIHPYVPAELIAKDGPYGQIPAELGATENPYGQIPPERAPESDYSKLPPPQAAESDYSKLPPPLQQMPGETNRLERTTSAPNLQPNSSADDTLASATASQRARAQSQTLSRAEFVRELVQGVDHLAARNPSLNEVLQALRQPMKQS